MFGLSNPLNAMQILFINILMDGVSSSRWQLHSASWSWSNDLYVP
jgi:hypothetical protein